MCLQGCSKKSKNGNKWENKDTTFSFVHIHFVMQTTLHNTQHSQAWHRASIRTVQMFSADLMVVLSPDHTHHSSLAKGGLVILVHFLGLTFRFCRNSCRANQIAEWLDIT